MHHELSIDKSAALALTPVSRETEARLDRYVELLLQWQAKTNLVAPSTLPNLWTRHISDSLQLLSIAPDAKTWTDFGSGGGFPGVVLACVMEMGFHLLRRAGYPPEFIDEVARTMTPRRPARSGRAHARSDGDDRGADVRTADDCLAHRLGCRSG